MKRSWEEESSGFMVRLNSANSLSTLFSVYESYNVSINIGSTKILFQEKAHLLQYIPVVNNTLGKSMQPKLLNIETTKRLNGKQKMK